MQVSPWTTTTSGRPDGKEIVHLARVSDDLSRGLHIAESPAGNRKRFRQRRTHQRPRGHSRQGREIGVSMGSEYNVLVDLIRQHEDIKFLRQSCDLQQLIPSKHPAARV